MNLMLHKVSILLICALNVLLVFCVRDNSHHRNGEQCELDNNQGGICREAKNCEYALQLIKDKRIAEVSRCQFEGRIPIVCCPQDTLASKPTTEAPTTKPSTTQASKPVPKYPKSKKFKKALCKDIPVFTVFSPNIVGGEPADVGEFPFQVALGYKNLQTNKIEYNCGGSLIADDIVLTAVHCANRNNNLPVTVKLGRTSLVPDEYDYGEGEDIDIQVSKH